MKEELKYGKVSGLGKDRDHKRMWGGEVRVEEKVDGSQFSFWKSADGVVCASRNRILPPDEDAGQFQKACEHVRTLYDRLEHGLVYRGECLQRPRHNVLAYDRVPRHHVVLWSVEAWDPHTGTTVVRDHDVVADHARRLDLEYVPILGRFVLERKEQLLDLVDGPSFLGGQREGIVVKQGNLRAKLVAESFKEVRHEKKTPGGDGIARVESLANVYFSTQRLQKAFQYLEEAGQLTGTMQDIGPLIKRLNQDVIEECEDEIKQDLYDTWWRVISKLGSRSVAGWYEKKLLGLLTPEE